MAVGAAPAKASVYEVIPAPPEMVVEDLKESVCNADDDDNDDDDDDDDDDNGEVQQ